jgi:hypothetical protein
MPLSYEIVTPPAHGTVSGSGLDLIYTSASDFGGTDGFVFRVTNGQTSSNDTAAIVQVFKPPQIVTAPFAAPNPVTTGTTTVLTTLAADDGGEPALKYLWTTTGAPPGPVYYSVNGTNAAKNLTATFTRAGSYTVAVTVNADVKVRIEPPSRHMRTGEEEDFFASLSDQFGVPQGTQPTFTWWVQSDPTGRAGIDQDGHFKAGRKKGWVYVTASGGAGQTGVAPVQIYRLRRWPQRLWDWIRGKRK